MYHWRPHIVASVSTSPLWKGTLSVRKGDAGKRIAAQEKISLAHSSLSHKELGFLMRGWEKQARFLWLKPHSCSFPKCRLNILPGLGRAGPGWGTCFQSQWFTTTGQHRTDSTRRAFVFPTAKWFWGILAPKLLAIRWGFPISIKTVPTRLVSGKSLLSGSANRGVNVNAVQTALPKVFGNYIAFPSKWLLSSPLCKSCLHCFDVYELEYTKLLWCFCSSCFSWQINYKLKKKKHVISLKSLYGLDFSPVQTAPSSPLPPAFPCPNVSGFTVIKRFFLLTSKNKDAEMKTKYINRSCHPAGRIFR